MTMSPGLVDNGEIPRSARDDNKSGDDRMAPSDRRERPRVGFTPRLVADVGSVSRETLSSNQTQGFVSRETPAEGSASDPGSSADEALPPIVVPARTWAIVDPAFRPWSEPEGWTVDRVSAASEASGRKSAAPSDAVGVHAAVVDPASGSAVGTASHPQPMGAQRPGNPPGAPRPVTPTGGRPVGGGARQPGSGNRSGGGGGGQPPASPPGPPPLGSEGLAEAMAALGHPVSRETLERLAIYADLLTRWTRRINLVGPNTLPDLWRRHLLDSLQLMPLIPAGAGTLVDLGTGAGLPGLPLAIACPWLAVTLVESDQRKAAFLLEAARLTGAKVKVAISRIETAVPFAADIVTARALAPLTSLFEWATPFAAESTLCLFHKGAAATAELNEAQRHWTMTADRVPSITEPAATILKISTLRRR